MYEPKYWNMGFDVPVWDEREYEIIRTHDQFDKVEQEWSETDDNEIAVDTETDSLDHTDVTVAGIPFGFDWYKSYYLPLNHFKGENANHELIDRLFNLIYSSDKVCFYNARFDMRILETLDFDIDKMDYFDVSVLVYNMDTECQNKKLEHLKEHVLGWPVTNVAPTTIIYRRPEDTLDYTAGDSHATYILPQIFDGFYQKLKTPVDIDNKFIRPLKVTEETPKHIDVEWFRKIKQEAEQEKEEILEKVYDAFGRKFNVSSKPQLRRVLKDHGLETGEETDGGKMSTGEDALKAIRDEHEGVDYLLEYRSIEKHINTFIDPFVDDADIQLHETGMDSLFREQNQSDKKTMHFSYRNTKTGTGRLSAGKDENNPYFAPINCQNLVKPDEKQKYNLVEGNSFLGYSIEETDGDDYDFKAPTTHLSIRHGIKPQPNCFHTSLDYSGQEIRILGNITKEPSIIEEMLEGDEDFYLLVRDNVLNQFGKYDRGTAKVFVLSVLYGAGPWNVKNQLELGDKDEGQKVLDELWELCPNVKEWRDKKIRKAEKDEYVTNYFGRVRWVHDLLEDAKEEVRGTHKSIDDAWQYKSIKRKAGNTPIQGTASDQMKIGCNRVYDNVFKKTDDIHFEVQVHDELNFSIKDNVDYAKKWIPRIKNEMEVDIKDWPIPIPVDVEIGPSFGLMCEVDVYDNGEIWLPNGELLR